MVPSAISSKARFPLFTALLISLYVILSVVVLAGSGGAGKSSMLLRWCENKFLEEYAATIGVEFGGRTIELPYGRIKLQLWDLGASEGLDGLNFCGVRTDFFFKP